MRFKDYSRFIRYWLFVLTLFVMVASIQVYINESAITNNINQTIAQRVNTVNENSYDMKYYSKYLEQYSGFASTMKRRQSGLVWADEYIIKFYDLDQQVELINTNKIDEVKKQESLVDLTQPQAAWTHFLSAKRDFLKKEFVIGI